MTWTPYEVLRIALSGWITERFISRVRRTTSFRSIWLQWSHAAEKRSWRRKRSENHYQSRRTSTFRRGQPQEFLSFLRMCRISITGMETEKPTLPALAFLEVKVTPSAEWLRAIAFACAFPWSFAKTFVNRT